MTQPTNDLLRHILDAQIDDGAGDTLTEDRICEVLDGRAIFSAAERRLLWTAPVARRRYLRLRREAAAQAEEAMRRSGVEFECQRMVAAAADNVPDVIESTDWTLRIIRDPDPELCWILILQLKESFLEKLPDGLSVRLADSGGRTWLQGRPDNLGEIHGGWGDPTTSPTQRRVDHHLKLTIV